MTKAIVPIFICALLLFAGHLINADSAVAYDNDCPRRCISQATDCTEKVKDSPNEIDRELCEKERRECLVKCGEEFRKDMDQADKERVLKEQEQKAIWDYQGLTLEQQKEEKLNLERMEQEKLDEEREERKEREREEQERVDRKSTRLNSSHLV